MLLFDMDGTLIDSNGHLEGRGHAFLGEARSALYAGIL